MINNILWLALGLLTIASIIPKGHSLKFAIAGSGWVFFSFHWALQWQHYYELADYVNVFLTILAAAACLLFGFVFIKKDKRLFTDIKGISTTTSLFMATTAAAIGGLSYFIFSEIPSMNTWIITTVTNQTIWLASIFGVVITRLDWNLIAVNGYKVEIILACTAIESIALFTGIIVSANAPAKRLAMAFFVSVPVIYALNLIRNVFVVDAYGMNWFGDPETSFYIAHTVIAKIGSLVALFLIAFAVLKILPEIIDMIDGVVNLIGGLLRNAG
ncbi:MAG: archaeosortase A [Candidatus Methanoperedens sp.]|nr:archaeosortase A [Candidatus Methanoperedens sp.]MCE8424973.1 archaeosortase A [Candidatus Methanoperedens sp.]MCE8427407.1 archaeosortase A [Candidatus Methanoperedens sp.]